MKHILSLEDQEKVRNLDAMIIADEKSGGYKRNETIDPAQTRSSAFIQSFGAEVAFQRMNGLEPVFELNKSFRWIDLWFRGQAIDVKQTVYFTGHLTALDWHDNPKNPLDIYVLMVGDFPRYEYRGWAWKNELILPENMKTLRYQPEFCLSQFRLHKEEIPQKKESYEQM